MCDREIGPPHSFPARRTPLLLYHIEASLSIGKPHKNKKNDWWFLPPIISKVGKGVFVPVFLEETTILATVTTGHIVRGVHHEMDALFTMTLLYLFRLGLALLKRQRNGNQSSSAHSS